MLTALAAGDTDTLATAAANDLTDAAISAMPELTEVMEAGRDAGALLPLLSGTARRSASSPATPTTHSTSPSSSRPRAESEALLTTGPASGAHVIESH